MGDYVMQGPIEAMYRAGKQDIPAEGALISRVASRLYDAMTTINVQSAYAGDPKLLTSMLTVGGEVYDGLRNASVSLDHCAVAVIRTANDFVAHDDKASEDYQHLSTSLKNAPTPSHTQPPELDDPGAPGAYNPDATVPERPGRGGLEYHPEDYQVPSTPAPVDPSQDEQDRDGDEQEGIDANPIPTPESSPR